MATKNPIRYIKIYGVVGQENKTYSVENGRIKEPRQRQRERNVEELIRNNNEGQIREWKWRGNKNNNINISNNAVESQESCDDCYCDPEPRSDFSFDDVLNLCLDFG